MTRQVQIRRGSATAHTNFTGAIGEVTMDTTNKTLRVHDGATPGGTILAKQSEIPTIPTSVEMAHNSMPSNRFDNLTLGASGTKYTAPADGYFALMINSGASGEYCNLYVEDENGQSLYCITNHSTNVGYNQAQLVPILKGYKLKISYTMSGNIGYFKFIYAQGAS